MYYNINIKSKISREEKTLHMTEQHDKIEQYVKIKSNYIARKELDRPGEGRFIEENPRSDRYYNQLCGLHDSAKARACYINTIKDTNAFIPILLTTSEAIITEYGVYSNYISSGFYICKILDYIQQCSLAETEISRCSINYTYIGDRYQRLFPFKLYRGPFPPQTDADIYNTTNYTPNIHLISFLFSPNLISTGGGYYKKYLKYKTKYLQLKQ